MSAKTHSSSQDAETVLSENPSSSGIRRIRFYVSKNHLRTIEFNDNGKSISIYHVYPRVADWVGREAPDAVNPRSHEKNCLESHVADDIETTLTESPEDFQLANRGGALIVDSFKYDKDSGLAEYVINDIENQGLADGATTDAVIHKVQTRIANGRPFRSLKEDEIPDFLKKARLHLEIIVGLDANDRDRIHRLVKGRNTSLQVKSWTMTDFEHKYDWISEALDRDNGPFHGRIGYEENAGKETTILDVLSLLTLFHWEYEETGGGPTERSKAPTIAYSSKGRMDARLKDEKLLPGYKALEPILEDILRLHDYVYANFEIAYDKAFGAKSRLGRRQGVESREAKKKPPITLPLTGSKSNYVIPSGLIFPLLASFRALIKYEGKKACWKTDPFKFFDKYGPVLIVCLFEQVELLGNNPNTAGKKKAVYSYIHKEARHIADNLENGPQN